MSRPRKPKTADLDQQLADAWHTYRTRTRPVWMGAPAAERRYLRSLDQARFSQDRALMLAHLDGAWRGLVADVRKICGREAHVEVVSRGPTCVPVCALVRVPNGSIATDDHTLGKPRANDVEAHEWLAALARAGTSDADPKVAKYYVKMVAALTEAREKMLLKQHALAQREGLARDHNAWDYWSKRSYLAHGRADRCMRRAVAYKNKLEALGLVYDLTHIETPISIPEEGHDEQRRRPRGSCRVQQGARGTARARAA